MLLPLVYMAAPQAFVDAVDHRIANSKLHVTDWWADDLDGDKTPEAIATICDDDKGFFLVQHGKDLLEAPIEIDGRNSCQPASRPAWTEKKLGVITDDVGVRHGSMTYSYAIRDGKLVLVRMTSSGFDVNRDGSHDEQDDTVDYDKLTWTRKQTGSGASSGLLVIATPHAHRATTITGKTTIDATYTDRGTTIHVHASGALTIRTCNAQPCTTIKVAKGDQDVPMDSEELEVIASGSTYKVHVERVDGDDAYPAPPKPW